MREFYAKHFLGIELLAALIAAFAFAYIHARTPIGVEIDALLKDNRAAIYATVTSVFGALLGFIITALSIVLGYASDPRLKALRENRHYRTLWSIFISSTRWLALATTVCVLALIVDKESAHHPIMLYLAFATAIVAVSRIARVLWVIENLVWILVNRTAIAEASQQVRGDDAIKSV